MDFDFTLEQLEYKNGVIKFTQKELNNDVIKRDKGSIFSRELWKKCADFGIFGLPFPKQYGGTDCDILTTLIAMEGFG